MATAMAIALAMAAAQVMALVQVMDTVPIKVLDAVRALDTAPGLEPETATVTAMSMIDATTGLRAFAFFLNFLKYYHNGLY